MRAMHVVKALALPKRARVHQRAPQKMLAEHRAPTAADRRPLTDGAEELRWIAALKPGTVAIPEYRADGRGYLEVAVLSVQVRTTHGKASQWLRPGRAGAPGSALPVLLIQPLVLSAIAKHDGRPLLPLTQLALSLAHKRPAQNEAGTGRLYYVVETKSSLFADDLRNKESAKTVCGRAHFKALAISENPVRYVVARLLSDLMWAIGD